MTHEKDECVAFVYTPKRPSCNNADGSCNFTKLNGLIEKAKEGDDKAIMLVFEQYQGLWKKIVGEFTGLFMEQGMDDEDMQQEAFVYFLISLKCYKPCFQNSFGNLYDRILRLNLTEMLRKEYKLVNLNFSLCSLETTDENGDLLYDIPVDMEKECFSDYYPQIKALLCDREFQIAIAHYVDGISLKTISKQLGVSYRNTKYVVKAIKEKLKVLYQSPRV